MEEADYKAEAEVQKALCIITIVLALLLNLALLYKIVRAAGGLVAVVASPRGPRFQTLVSLIFCDISVALFSLGVQAWTSFETNNSVSCKTRLLSKIYLTYIMPFVHGMGLVVLFVEGAMFRRRVRRSAPPQSHGVVLSLAVSAVPWMLAFGIAMPLAIAGADLDSCRIRFSRNRQMAIVLICQMLPVAVTTLATCLNMCTCSAGQSNLTRIPLADGTAPVQPTASLNEDKQGDRAKPQPGPLGFSEALDYPNQPPAYPEPPPSILNYYSLKERAALGIASLLFFVSVVPTAVFTLGYTLNENHAKLKPWPLTIITDIIYWLMAARTFVTPLSWLITGSLKYLSPRQNIA